MMHFISKYHLSKDFVWIVKGDDTKNRKPKYEKVSSIKPKLYTKLTHIENTTNKDSTRDIYHNLRNLKES